MNSTTLVRADLVRLAHRGAGLRDFAFGATRILARAVPFDGMCVAIMDPATHVPTSSVLDNGPPPGSYGRLKEIEFGGEDFIAVPALALADRRAAALSQATGGVLERSLRHREIMRPHGFGDELRAALVGDGMVWGALMLVRGADREPFTEADTALLEGMTAELAEGLRRTTLLDSEPADGEDAAGMLVLDPDGSISFADEVAAGLLEELGGDPPVVVTAVAAQARLVAAGLGDGRIARARVRAQSGRWLIVRASVLGDGHAPVAVIIEPARPHELAPLLADAHRLTEREREVTQLVARGLSTDEIAERLYMSPWTVQDHLKAIFEKVGVTSRGQLVARLFFGQGAPRLTDT